MAVTNHHVAVTAFAWGIPGGISVPFDMSKDRVKSSVKFDAAWFRPDPVIFTRLGIAAAKKYKPTSKSAGLVIKFYNPFVKRWVVARGQPLREADEFSISHNVSTVPGTSGAPVFTSGDVLVGLHCGEYTNRKENRYTDWFLILERAECRVGRMILDKMIGFKTLHVADDLIAHESPRDDSDYIFHNKAFEQMRKKYKAYDDMGDFLADQYTESQQREMARRADFVESMYSEEQIAHNRDLQEFVEHDETPPSQNFGSKYRDWCASYRYNNFDESQDCEEVRQVDDPDEVETESQQTDCRDRFHYSSERQKNRYHSGSSDDCNEWRSLRKQMDNEGAENAIVCACGKGLDLSYVKQEIDGWDNIEPHQYSEYSYFSGARKGFRERRDEYDDLDFLSDDEEGNERREWLERELLLDPPIPVSSSKPEHPFMDYLREEEIPYEAAPKEGEEWKHPLHTNFASLSRYVSNARYSMTDPVDTGKGLVKIGKCKPRHPAKDRDPLPVIKPRLDALIETGLSEDDVDRVLSYGNVPRGESAKFAAYSKHVSRPRVSKIDDSELQRAVSKAVKTRYVLQHAPSDLETQTVRSIESNLYRYVSTVNGSKNPGYPYNLRYSTNHEVLENEYAELKRTCAQRLYMWLNLSDEEFEVMVETPMLFVINGYVDPSSVFIKDEPHPRRKVQDKRYRCITPVSLVDQVCEAYLFDEMAQCLKGDLLHSGSAIGLGATEEDFALLKGFVKEEETVTSCNVVSDDVSGFDGLHTEQMLEATHQHDKQTFKCAKGKCKNFWRAQKRWVQVRARSTTVFHEEIFMKYFTGMIDSGSRDTSRRNTTLRIIYGWLILGRAGVKRGKVVAHGDDALTFGVKDIQAYKKAAEEIGIALRDVRQSPDSTFEFCSRLYDYSTHRVPLTSWPKSIYRILTRKVLAPDDVRQLTHEMRWNDVLPKINTWLDVICPLPETEGSLIGTSDMGNLLA
jgi:hypothetical protein